MDQLEAFSDAAHTHVAFNDGLLLDCGVSLARLVVAYRTYGSLDPARANAVLVCHALTGDQYWPAAPDHRQAGLVGGGGRSGPADRHPPVFRDPRQRARRLHGLDRAAQRS